MPLPTDAPPVVGGSRTLADDVFDRLSAAIVDEQFAPGEVIHDREIAQTLGVSRTPVREALRRLTQLGLVEVVANRYTRVTAVDDGRVADTLEYAGYQAGIALRMAVQRMTDAEVAATVDLIDAVLEANSRDDHAALFDRARELVAYTTARSRNAVFQAVMRGTGVMVLRNLRTRRPVRGTLVERERAYRAMRDAVATRDADGAERAFRVVHAL